MKRTITRLLIMLLCGTMGWMLGYLRIPHIEKNHAFWIGFAACAALITLIGIMRARSRKRSISAPDVSNQSPETAPKTNRGGLVIPISVAFVFIVVAYLFNKQTQLEQSQDKMVSDHRKAQAQINESIRSSNLIMLMDNVLEKVESELKEHPETGLSDATIARIASLSYSFKPYSQIQGDTLSATKLSPERGKLLLSLAMMELDSLSFAKIKTRASFAKSDLSDVNLSGIDLSGVDLHKANLKNARLERANLSHSDLRKCNFWGATMDSIDLSEADMRRANLDWAKMSGGTLVKTNLNGASLKSTVLIGANLTESTFQMAQFSGTLLQHANMVCSNVRGASMVRVNFTGTDLTDAYMVFANIRESTISNTVLANAEVHKEWFDEMKDWKVKGAEEMTTNYELIGDSTFIGVPPKYFLKNK